MAEPERRPYEIVSSKIDWSCPWYKVRKDDIRLPDGQAAEYNVIDKGDAAIIVPLTADLEVVLIRVYRHTIDRWCWEVPAGSAKAGQDWLETATAELQEEIGGTAGKMTHLGSFYSMNGISSVRRSAKTDKLSTISPCLTIWRTSAYGRIWRVIISSGSWSMSPSVTFSATQ